MSATSWMKGAAWLLGVAGLVLGAIVITSISYERNLVYPTPETESAFYKSFTPDHVIGRYKRPYISTEAGGGGGSAKHDFACHEKQFDAVFGIASKDDSALMAALNEEIRTALVSGGETITWSGMDGKGGFRIDYVSERLEGNVIAYPLDKGDPRLVSGFHPCCPGDTPVRLRLYITERWFAKASGEPHQSPTWTPEPGFAPTK